METLTPAIRRMPTAYCAPSQHGSPVSAEDQLELRQHDLYLRRKSIAASERQAKWAATLHEHSPRTRKRMSE